MSVFVIRHGEPELPAGAGQHFLLDTGTLSLLAHSHGVPALKTWKAPVIGYVSPTAQRGTEVMGG
jgi:hypothetical protein